MQHTPGRQVICCCIHREKAIFDLVMAENNSPVKNQNKDWGTDMFIVINL
jgi:hypothetical protein